MDMEIFLYYICKYFNFLNLSCGIMENNSSNKVAIEVKNVSRSFKLTPEKIDNLK